MISRKKQIAIDRLTMTVSEVAAKYNRSIRYINHLTEKSALKPNFKDDKNAKKFVKIKGKREPKTPKTAIPIKDDLLQKMNKGEVKLQKGEMVFKTKVHDATQQRQIYLRDPKNTVIFVKMSDPRTDEQIRNQFLNKSL